MSNMSQQISQQCGGAKWICLGLIVVACAPSATALAAVIRVMPTAEVTTSVIRLQDVAVVADDNEALRARLSQVVLGPAPLPGKAVSLTHQEIRTRLESLGENMSQIEITGRVSVAVRGKSSSPVVSPAPVQRVTPASLQVPAHDVDAQVAAVLLEAFRAQFVPQDRQRAAPRVKIQALQADWSELLAATSARVRYELTEIPYGGPQTWTARVGTERRPIAVTAWVEEPRSLVVTKRGLWKGRVIEKHDVELREVEAAEETGVEDLALVIGSEATRNVAANTFVKPTDLAKSSLARPNDIITVQARRGGIVVKRPCKALGSAGLNELLLVQPLDDPRERLNVRMTAYHEAEVAGD